MICIGKTSFKKIWALIRSMKFFSLEVALYPHKSTIQLCMECSCDAWAGASSCYLEMVDKPLAHHRNAASLNLFYRYEYGRCSHELVQLVPSPYSQRRTTLCSDRLHDFSVTILRCQKHVYVNSLFRLRNLNNSRLSTVSFIIFCDFSMFYQIFHSPQVKRWAIITYKHGIYELPHELPNDLRFRIRKLGNVRKVFKLYKMIA